MVRLVWNLWKILWKGNSLLLDITKLWWIGILGRLWHRTLAYLHHLCFSKINVNWSTRTSMYNVTTHTTCMLFRSPNSKIQEHQVSVSLSPTVFVKYIFEQHHSIIILDMFDAIFRSPFRITPQQTTESTDTKSEPLLSSRALVFYKQISSARMLISSCTFNRTNCT